MQDRVPVNPGRVLIKPENGSASYYATMTRADNPTQEGTPLNKASLLKDSTAAKFGLGSNAVPDDVLSMIPEIMNHSWRKIQAYETAGTYTFNVPDLFGGKSYNLGYMVIGGGGGGSAGSVNGKYYVGASGGCSGFSTYGIINVSPGQSKAVVVGSGGTGAVASAAAGAVTGGNGGTSSFDGNTAEGGSAGVTFHTSNTGSNKQCLPGRGGQLSHLVNGYNVPNKSIEPFGGTQIFEMLYSSTSYTYNAYMTDVLSCFNPFEQKRILSAGGSAAVLNMSNAYYGDSSDGGRGAGKGVAQKTSGAAATASSATVAGCGGGTAAACGGTATAGSGAPGAVYLYVMGGGS